MNYINQTFNRTAADSGGTTAYDDAAALLAEDIRTALVAADSGITALTGSEVGVLINNKFKLLIENGAVSGSRTIVFTVRNGSTDLFSFYAGCQVGSSGDAAKQMKMNIHMGICNNGFSMIIRNAKTTGDYFTAQIIAVTTTDGITAVGYNTCGASGTWTSASSTRNFASDTTLFDLRNNARSLTLAHRLKYYHEATNANIAVLTNKVLLSGDMRVGDVNIIDCSTVTGDAACPYDNTDYYAVDSNTLIPVG
jgi:hypothetical protein